MADRVVALAESCSVDLTHLDAKVSIGHRWKAAASERSFVRVRFAPARPMNLTLTNNRGHGRVAVSEILVAVPEKEWPVVMVRGEGGVMALTKYAPCQLVRVIGRDGLALGSPDRYREMDRLCEETDATR
jgi:hypothetical protein